MVLKILHCKPKSHVDLEKQNKTEKESISLIVLHNFWKSFTYKPELLYSFIKWNFSITKGSIFGKKQLLGINLNSQKQKSLLYSYYGHARIRNGIYETIRRCPIQWTHPLEYRLLTGEGQSHVYPPHGHPVQVWFPVLPLKPDGGVTHGAHVLEEPDPD